MISLLWLTLIWLKKYLNSKLIELFLWISCIELNRFDQFDWMFCLKSKPIQIRMNHIVSSQLFLSVAHRNWVNIYLELKMIRITDDDSVYSNNLIYVLFTTSSWWKKSIVCLAILRKWIDWETFANFHWPRTMMHHWTDGVKFVELVIAK